MMRFIRGLTDDYLNGYSETIVFLYLISRPLFPRRLYLLSTIIIMTTVISIPHLEKSNMNNYRIPGAFFNISQPIVARFQSATFVNSHFSNPQLAVEKTLRCVETDSDYILRVKQSLRDKYLPIWSRLPPHEHVSSVLAIDCDSHLPTIKVPFYENGNIRDYNRHSSGSDKIRQITEIASGMKHLHDNGVCHGNVCPTNILVKDSGIVCISDAPLNVNMRELSSYKPTPASYRYKSPEELQGSKVSYGGDVYSWASVTYEVLSGRQPYYGLHYGCSVFNIIHHGHRALERPSEISPELWGIMLRCWAVEPEDRPMIHEVESEVRDF